MNEITIGLGTYKRTVRIGDQVHVALGQSGPVTKIERKWGLPLQVHVETQWGTWVGSVHKTSGTASDGRTA